MKTLGFTLIEVLVYIALFSMLMLGCISSIFQITESAGSIETQSEVSDESIFVLEKLSTVIKAADSIQIPGVGETSSALHVMTPAGPVTYDLVSGMLFQTRNANSVQVSGNGISVTNLSLTHVAGVSGDPEHVDISISVESRSTSGRILHENLERSIYALPM